MLGITGHAAGHAAPTVSKGDGRSPVGDDGLAAKPLAVEHEAVGQGGLVPCHK